MAVGCDELVSQRAAIPAVTEFMIQTGLLGQFGKVDTSAMGVEEQGEAGRGGET